MMFLVWRHREDDGGRGAVDDVRDVQRRRDVHVVTGQPRMLEQL